MSKGFLIVGLSQLSARPRRLGDHSHHSLSSSHLIEPHPTSSNLIQPHPSPSSSHLIQPHPTSSNLILLLPHLISYDLIQPHPTSSFLLPHPSHPTSSSTFKNFLRPSHPGDLSLSRISRSFLKSSSSSWSSLISSSHLHFRSIL